MRLRRACRASAQQALPQQASAQRQACGATTVFALGAGNATLGFAAGALGLAAAFGFGAVFALGLAVAALGLGAAVFGLGSDRGLLGSSRLRRSLGGGLGCRGSFARQASFAAAVLAGALGAAALATVPSPQRSWRRASPQALRQPWVLPSWQASLAAGSSLGLGSGFRLWKQSSAWRRLACCLLFWYRPCTFSVQ